MLSLVVLAALNSAFFLICTGPLLVMPLRSRGRRLRTLIVPSITIPFAYAAIWIAFDVFSVWINDACNRDRSDQRMAMWLNTSILFFGASVVAAECFRRVFHHSSTTAMLLTVGAIGAAVCHFVEIDVSSGMSRHGGNYFFTESLPGPGLWIASAIWQAFMWGHFKQLAVDKELMQYVDFSYCPRCAYDLAGITIDLCPECGERIRIKKSE